MSKAEQRTAQRTYHAFVAVILLLCGGGLLGMGIWLTVSDGPSGLFNLAYVGDGGFFDVVLRTNIIAMIVGGFLLLSAIVSLIALARNTVGKIFRVIHFIMAVVIFLVLAAVCVVSALLVARRNDGDVRDFVSNAWKRTAENEPSVLCHIENVFQCRGLNDNDCIGCLAGTETACLAPGLKDVCVRCENSNYDVNAEIGCYNKMVNTLKNWLMPIAIVSGILAIVVLIDIFITCCL